MKILLVGDTHANTPWFHDVVLPAAARLDVDRLLIVGDFGYWPGRADEFLEAAASSPVPVLFIDGNHEDHPALTHDVTVARHELGLTSLDPVPLAGSLTYLPRGSRLVVEGRTLAFLGGARSIDRAWRTPGVDWFLEEAVHQTDLARLAAGGACDVLITHDAPSRTQLPLLADHEIPEVWRRERPACDEHRRRIDEACAATRPAWLVHGHYHLRWTGEAVYEWGRIEVVALAEDGTSPYENLALLDIGAGRCEVLPVRVDE